MFIDPATLATLVLIPLPSFASPIAQAESSISASTRSYGDKTILARTPPQPSAYPLPPGPQPNEFKYVNWDPKDKDQIPQLEKIHQAFGEWRQMAMQAQSRIQEDQTMINRWFNVPENIHDQIGIFSNMWNSTTGQAATPVSLMVCDYEDFDNFCNQNINAYTNGDTGRFHICPKGFSLPMNSDIQCQNLDASCSKKMRSLSMSLLHEMTHFNRIGADARGSMGIVDVDNGKGAYDCFMLNTDDKSDNAQNYAWFAGEAYWTRECIKRFDDPAPGIV